VAEYEADTSSATSTTRAAPSLPPTNPAHQANTSDFTRNVDGQPAYYFSTPSGRWRCAILPGDMAGCEATGGALNIADAPNLVPNADGAQKAPNAIVVEPQGDAHFAAVDTAKFAPPGPANVLPFNRTLAAARYRCNIQETKGVSCLSEESGEGFTFSADGFNLQYSEVPLDTP
jgi:hypothetical protein